MKIQLERNDNCYTVNYYPDTHEIELDSIEGDDYNNLFVAEGTFPNVKYVPLAQVLLREAERQYADDEISHHEETYYEDRREILSINNRECP